MDFGKSKTFGNLCTSFTAECQEGARYQFMAKMCVQQKLTTLQRILKDLATNEMSHAQQFFNKIEEHCKNVQQCKNVPVSATYNYSGGDLQAMLYETVAIEEHQQKVVYKEFAKTAEAEGFADIADLFQLIAKIEGDHAMLVAQIADQLKSNTIFKTKDIAPWKCSECGHEIEDTKAPNTCPVCQNPQGTFYMKTDLARYFKR
jgi:rubrerythrin